MRVSLNRVMNNAKSPCWLCTDFFYFFSLAIVCIKSLTSVDTFTIISYYIIAENRTIKNRIFTKRKRWFNGICFVFSPHMWGWSRFWQLKSKVPSGFPYTSGGDPKKAVLIIEHRFFTLVFSIRRLLPVSLFTIADQAIVNRRLCQVIIADAVRNFDLIKNIAVRVLHPEHVQLPVSQVA